jgi:hypothetical protein
MTLMLPYGLNAALNDRRPSPLARAGQVDPLKKLAEIAARGEPSAREKAETIGKMIMSGALRAGDGPNGNASLQKRAQERRYSTMSDNPEKTRLNKAVGEALAGLRGHIGHPGAGFFAKTIMPGVGERVRALKASNDDHFSVSPLRNLPMLPGTQAPQINEDALQVLNSLPDARIRNGAINAILLRPPANPNENYRWIQTIVSLRQQIKEMCQQIGLDPTALTDLLDRKLEWFDPMVQTQPATNPPPRSNVGPTTEDLDVWRDRADPPAEPIDPGPFAGADTTDLNPDLGAEEKLAKFYDHAKRGVDIRKSPMTRKELEQYGRVVLKSEVGGPLRHQILLAADVRESVSPRIWEKITDEPDFKAMLKSIVAHPNLTRAMKGACLALII